MIHIDVKTWGRIDGVGHRHLLASTRRVTTVPECIGYEHLHVAIDECFPARSSVELLFPSPTGGCHGFPSIAPGLVRAHGRCWGRTVMTDNGSAIAQALRPGFHQAQARHV
ncbi:MAG: hypothetical protein MO852_04835 [Candidatus Devosia euplotis]|nr:hypothetical protein [Candidatus Devosia euplotis]